MTAAASWHSARRIAALAWPVLIGQLAVVAFTTIDTLLLAHHSALDLAALAIGQVAYLTVFIGFMGVVLAIGPIVGQHFGARRLVQAGRQLHQTVWLTLGLSVVGSALLLAPGVFLGLFQIPLDVQGKVHTYLLMLAFSLPASLLFTTSRGFNNAISRPKAVMVLQVCALALKVPLSALLIFGAPAAHVPSLGVAGAGLATCLCMWAQALAAAWLLRRDPYYQPFELWGRGLHRPDRAALLNQLRLGVPMGLSILIEVTGFAFMSLFIARLGTTALAGHQIAVNLVSMMFMLPLAVGSATGTLAAQRIGAQDAPDARRVAWHGVQLAAALAALLGLAVYLGREQVVRWYTPDAAVAAACLPLLAWLPLFHLVDAAQTVATFVLRAYRVATLPMFVFAGSLWGVGLGGGYVLAFDVWGLTPPALRGAPGYWVASTLGLLLAAAVLMAVLAAVLRGQSDSNVRPAA